MATIELTTAEQSTLVLMLDNYDQKLSNAGCNDFEMEVTQENLELINAANEYAGYNETYGPILHNGKFCIEDQTILQYLRWLIAGKPVEKEDD